MLYSLAIGWYRRYLSPYKGFRCAAARHTGGLSCSAAVEAILNEYGLIRGLPLIRLRFAECRAASLALAAQAGPAADQGDSDAPRDGHCGRRRSRRRAEPSRCDGDESCDALGDVDCAPTTCDDLACSSAVGELACNSVSGITESAHACDIGSCEFGSCDFS